MGKRFKLEDGLQRLEEIVEGLEADDLDLDRALALFDEGMELIRSAERVLAESEGRVRQVLADRQDRQRLRDVDVAD